MRFRKTVNICKGVKMNLSKSGASFTVGGKGISLNLGKNGVFLNTGLPGTGIYDRKRILGGFGDLFGKKDKEEKKSKAKTEREEIEIDVRDYELLITEEGAIEIFASNGSRASDEVAREIRKTDWYEAQSDALMQEFREQIEDQTEAFVSLYQKSKKVLRCGEPEDLAVMEEKLDTWLTELELPMEFSVEYDFDEQTGAVLMDLDLPEIDDIPEEKAVEMASGAIKSKPKTLKELREDYRTCALGLGVYIASNVFDLCGGLSHLLISGYTQRRDKQTGEREDCYVYSIAFDRSEFLDDDCRTENPCSFCDRFYSRINVLASGELKQIQPYTPAEFAEICARED